MTGQSIQEECHILSAKVLIKTLADCELDLYMISDGTPLSDYKLTEGSKLNLVVKRREEAKAQATASSAGGQESQNSSDNSSAVSGASSKTAKAGMVTIV